MYLQARFVATIIVLTQLLTADIIKDPKKGLMWEDTIHAGEIKVNFKEAMQYCKDLRLGKFDDWRVPTLFELLSIIDFKRYKPAIKKPFKYVEDTGSYWTTTLYVGDKNERWVVSFKDGTTGDADESYERYVRCVRKL